MNAPNPLSRRMVLTGGLGLAGVGLLTPARASAAAAPGTSPGRNAHPDLIWSKRNSLNGWRVLPSAPVSRVEGSSPTLALAPGDVSIVLMHCLRRYLYEIDDTVRQAELTGHHTSRSLSAAFESNHLSGTALAIRPSWYPVGGAESMLARDIVVLRDILVDCQGVVRWGGDESPAKQSHLAIDVPPGDARLTRVADSIRGWRSTPGKGAGTVVDPFSPARRAAARSLANRQARR